MAQNDEPDWMHIAAAIMCGIFFPQNSQNDYCTDGLKVIPFLYSVLGHSKYF